MHRNRISATLLILVAIMVTPAISAKAGERLLTGEQIENRLFAKSKGLVRSGRTGLTPARRRAVDMHAVTFNSNSAQLTGRAKAQLDVLGTVMAKHLLSRIRFVIGGHTDAVGNDAYNKRLSQRRAEAVVDYLVTGFGIARQTLMPVGYGESRLLSRLTPTDPSQRRAEIINVGS